MHFYLTDAGNLIRLKVKSNLWEVFNPRTREWEIPEFEIEDIFTAIPVSKDEVKDIIKYMTKTMM